MEIEEVGEGGRVQGAEVASALMFSDPIPSSGTHLESARLSYGIGLHVNTVDSVRRERRDGSRFQCAEFERREKTGTVGNGETRQGRGG